MSHEDDSSGVGLSGEKVFDLASHDVLGDFAPNPTLLSELIENPGSEIVLNDSGDKVVGEPPRSVVESLQPELIEKSIHQMQDDLLVRSWLSQKSENTKRSYKRIATEFFTWIHPRSLKRVSLHDVESFVEGRVGFKKSTLALRIGALKSLLTHAHRTGYASENVGGFISGVKTDSKLTERYLTEEEVSQMILVSESIRDQAILRLLYNAGLRVSELVAINWCDIQERDDNEAQIKVLGKGNKQRVVRISKSAYEVIKALRKDDFKLHHALFASDYGNKTRLTDRTVREIVFKSGLRAGITKRVSPHWLRHAHASHALDRGAPIHLVQSTLGHASVATTGRYLHARPQESSGKYLID